MGPPPVRVPEGQKLYDALFDKVNQFSQHQIAPAAAGWSMGQSPSGAIYRDAAALGLTGLQVGKDQGGTGLDFAHSTALYAKLAEVDFGFAMSLVNTQNIALRLCQIAPPHVLEHHVPALLNGSISGCAGLTEPETGSDFAAIKTTARPNADGWVLNGEKTWIINGRHAGVSIVYAQCGALGDANSIGAFLVDLNAPGVTRYAIDADFSQTSMGTGGFRLKDVTIPHDHQLIAPGTAFKAIMAEINAARTYVAAMCDAMMGAAIAQVRLYGARRHAFGKPLNAIPSWQANLDAAIAALATSKDQTRKAIGLVTNKQDSQLAAAQAKIKAVTTAQQHLPELLQLMGAEGLKPDYPFSRHLAASQIAGFTDGATNVLKERVVKLTKQRGET